MFKKTVPSILQMEGAECGLACIAMIASYYGRSTTIGEMRQYVTTSQAGVSLPKLMKLANSLELKARPLKVGFKSLPKLALPCILHWGFNHFVVLTAINPRYIEINDPARGTLRLTHEEVAQKITGVVLEVAPTPNFQKRGPLNRLSARDFLRDAPGLRRSLIQLFLLAALLEVFYLLGPFYLQVTLDNVLVNNDNDLLFLLGLSFLAVTIFKAVVASTRAWSIGAIGANLNAHATDGTFRHLLNLPMIWFERRFVGDIVSRFSSIQRIQNALSIQFVSAVLDGLMSLGTLVVLALLSFQVMLATVVCFTLYLALRLALLQRLINLNRYYLVGYAKEYGHLVESVRGMLTVKLNNDSAAFECRHSNMVVYSSLAKLKSDLSNSLFMVVKESIFGLLRVGIIWYCAILVMRGELSVGTMLASLAYAELLANRGSALLDTYIDFKLLSVDLERVSDITSSPAEPMLPTVHNLEALAPELELVDVSFRYSDETPWIIRNLSLKVTPGESVAITGHSGGGKSTLLKLMLGILAPTTGKVLFGGQDISQLDPSDYRHLIGSVMQDDQLFSGTLGENICFFSEEFSMDNIVQAAKQADIHDYIVSLPQGYYTLVGDMGAALSGGQKQRIILARALYRAPRILLLDEATSHLDAASESRVGESVKTLKVTRVMIAHRKETIATADRCLMLQQGTVVDESKAVDLSVECVI